MSKSHLQSPGDAAAQDLDSLVRSIRTLKAKPSPEALNWIADQICSARAALLEPDPVRQRAYLIVMALRQSTTIQQRMVFGKPRDFTYITDRVLYNWAVTESHKMPERFA